MKNPFASKRIRQVKPDAAPVAPHLLSMGWHDPAADAGTPLDPYAAERSARHAGAAALAEHQKGEADRKRADMDQRLAGVRRGTNYGNPSR